MQLECPFCHAKQEAVEQLIGRETRCIYCGARFIVRFHAAEQPAASRNGKRRKILLALILFLVFLLTPTALLCLVRFEKNRKTTPTTDSPQTPATFSAALLDPLATDNLTAFQAEFLKIGSPDQRDSEGLTLLMRATDANAGSIVLLLLKQGASPELADPSGRTALVRAAAAGNGAMIETLLRGGADLNAGAGDGNTALAAAIDREDSILMETLLRSGAALWTGAARGNTPLIRAARRNFKSGVKLLLAANADPAATDANGETLIFHAIRAADPELLEIALRAGTPINQLNNASESAFYAALAARQAPLALRLLEAGADPTVETGHNLLAAATRYPQILAKLVPKLPDQLNAPDATGTTPLLQALKHGNTESAALLLKSGAQLALGENTSNDPLNGALSSANVETLRWVMKNVKIPPARLNQALAAAAKNGSSEMVAALLEAGADPLGAAPNALEIATASGFRDCIAILETPTREATATRDRRITEEVMAQISPRTPGESLRRLEKAAHFLEKSELPEAETVRKALLRYRELAKSYDTNRLKQVMERTRLLNSDDAFRQLAVALRQYPQASQREAAENICKKFQTDQPEKKTEYEEFEKRLDAIAAMSEPEVAADIATFVNRWLTDLQLGIDTTGDWAVKSLLKPLPPPASWEKPVPADQNWNAFETAAVIRFQTAAPEAGKHVYTLKLQRSPTTLQWQILAAEEMQENR